MTIDLAFRIVIWTFVISSLAGIYRILVGPTMADRLLGFSVVSSLVLAILVLYGARLELHTYLDVGLVYGIFGFVGLLALVRYLSKSKEK